MDREKLQLAFIAVAVGWLLHEFMTALRDLRRDIYTQQADLRKRVFDVEQKVDFVKEVRGLSIEVPKNPESIPEVKLAGN